MSVTASGWALILLAGALTFGAPEVGWAQGPAPSVLWQKPALVSPERLPAARIPARKAPDHRWEGMAIGAGLGLVAGGLLGLVACGGQQEANTSCAVFVVGLGLGGAFGGGIIGGLIGVAIPKGEPADSTAES